MSEMNEEQLKEALDHDAAIKAGNGGAKAPEAVDPDEAIFANPAAAAKVTGQIETRNSVLAKDLVTSFMQVAREFSGLALMTGKPNIQKDKKGEHVVHYDPPKPDAALKCLDAALRAMELARMADALGDRAIFRQGVVPKKAE
jgi:hypothetical protein